MSDGHVLEGIPPWDDLPIDSLRAATEDYQQVQSRYATARSLLEAFTLEDRNAVPGDAENAFMEALTALTNAVDAFQNPIPDVTPESRANRFIDAVNNEWTILVTRVRPHLRGQVTDWAAVATQAHDAAVSLAAVQAEWSTLYAKAQEVIEQVGVGQLWKHYQDEATGHREAASRWLVGVALSALVLIALVGWLMHGAFFVAPGAEWEMVATRAAAKAIGIGAISFAISFCSRNYRSQLHLQAAYRQRAASLATYTSMTVALKDAPEDKRIVLTELARAVFAATDTGFTQTGAGDKTIIENSVPLFGAFRGNPG